MSYRHTRAYKETKAIQKARRILRLWNESYRAAMKPDTSLKAEKKEGGTDGDTDGDTENSTAQDSFDQTKNTPNEDPNHLGHSTDQTSITTYTK